MVNKYVLLQPYGLPSIRDFIRRCTPHEAYLPAHQASSFQGPRFPSENGYRKRPQGSGSSSCQGPQGSVCLIDSNHSLAESQQIHRSNAKRVYSGAKSFLAPLPFYSWQALDLVCRQISGSFPAVLRYQFLVTHKVCPRN